jgi:hypothetical protein
MRCVTWSAVRSQKQHLLAAIIRLRRCLTRANISVPTGQSSITLGCLFASPYADPAED